MLFTVSGNGPHASLSASDLVRNDRAHRHCHSRPAPRAPECRTAASPSRNQLHTRHGDWAQANCARAAVRSVSVVAFGKHRDGRPTQQMNAARAENRCVSSGGNSAGNRPESHGMARIAHFRQPGASSPHRCRHRAPSRAKHHKKQALSGISPPRLHSVFTHARVAESVDAGDSKSPTLRGIRVRVSSRVLRSCSTLCTARRRAAPPDAAPPETAPEVLPLGPVTPRSRGATRPIVQRRS